MAEVVQAAGDDAEVDVDATGTGFREDPPRSAATTSAGSRGEIISLDARDSQP
jgi:hypothetical protein